MLDAVMPPVDAPICEPSTISVFIAPAGLIWLSMLAWPLMVLAWVWLLSIWLAEAVDWVLEDMSWPAAAVPAWLLPAYCCWVAEASDWVATDCCVVPARALDAVVVSAERSWMLPVATVLFGYGSGRLVVLAMEPPDIC